MAWPRHNRAMDDAATLNTLAMRDPLFTPRRLQVERRPDGTLVLFNPTPLELNYDTALGPLAYWAKAQPDRVWLAERAGDEWRTQTYGQGHEQVRAVAGGLHAMGLSRAAPLLILSRNSIDHALIAYAAMSRGTAIAAVSPQYGLAGADLSRLTHAVDVIRPSAVVVDDAAAFATGLSAPCLAGLPVIASSHVRPGDIVFASLLESAPAPAIAKGQDLAKLLLTSGSTGNPKAVMVLHRALAATAAQVAACYVDPESPIVVNAAPWSHSLGANAILHMVTHRGGTLYIDSGQPVAGRFAPTVRNLKDVATTYHNMVPAGWALLADELERDDELARVFFAKVRALQYGGAALAQSVCDRIQAVARRTIGQTITFGSGYGSTETGPTAANVHWPNLTMGLMGLPVPGTWVKLVPVGEKLEFRVKGPQISPGYFNGATAELDEEGYYATGDAARLVDPQDPLQGLAFDGRLSENFKLTSGTFVSAGTLRVEVVSALAGLVTDAVVCGENRDQVGLLLFLNPARAGALSGHENVIAALRDGLAAHNARAKGGGRIGRALILPDQPDLISGEVTDKGYINQGLARARRADAIMRLFAPEAHADVIIL